MSNVLAILAAYIERSLERKTYVIGGLWGACFRAYAEQFGGNMVAYLGYDPYPLKSVEPGKRAERTLEYLHYACDLHGPCIIEVLISSVFALCERALIK